MLTLCCTSTNSQSVLSVLLLITKKNHINLSVCISESVVLHLSLFAICIVVTLMHSYTIIFCWLLYFSFFIIINMNLLKFKSFIMIKSSIFFNNSRSCDLQLMLWFLFDEFVSWYFELSSVIQTSHHQYKRKDLYQMTVIHWKLMLNHVL
jgi:uncharacterized membrane protein